MRLGGRPDSVSVLEEGNVLTVWPTKMVLAPLLAKRVSELVVGKVCWTKQQWHPERSGKIPGTAHRAVAPTLEMEEVFRDWERPGVALPPWERLTEWTADQDVARRTGQQRRAA